MMFGYDTRISMDDEYDEYEAEEMDTIEGKLENNRRWLADNDNCHSPQIDRDREYHESRIHELEHRREQIRREKDEKEMRRRQNEEYD